MSDDQTEGGMPADNAAGLATGMIVVTGIMLLVAIITVWTVLKNHYGEGPLA